MSVKSTAKKQYAQLLNNAATTASGIVPPRSGWIVTMRKALGMSAPELARRIGVTKAAIYQAERKEVEGGVTLQHMTKLAEGLGGRFVYAIVPEESIEQMLHTQALSKAQAIVQRASVHMALENQALSSEQQYREIDALADEILRKQSPDFWKESV